MKPTQQNKDYTHRVQVVDIKAENTNKVLNMNLKYNL